MATDNNIYELIEQYLKGELHGDELLEFVGRLETDAEFRAEVEMFREVEDAISETDIAELRENLSRIISAETTARDPFFGLAEEISKVSDFEVEEDEIDSFGNSLQKLHLQNHQRSLSETVHDVYSSEEEEIADADNMSLSEEDELLFKEIEQAVSEKGIIDLRSNLEAIARNTSSHDISIEDIDEYISGGLNEDGTIQLELEASINSSLASDIELLREIDHAVGEDDIMELRSALEDIGRTGSSHSRSVREIERYLDKELDIGFMASFEDELAINPGLVSEVHLHEEVEEAIGETDIIGLRTSLSAIQKEKESEEKKVKRGIILPGTQKLAWYVAAASVVLVLSVAGFIRKHTYTNNEIYAHYYEPYNSGGVFRSASNEYAGLKREAMAHFNHKEYDAALELFSQILKENENNPAINFYSGAIFQDKKQYDKALGSYKKVSVHNDNLFVEQARWYIGLCYLQREEKDEALEVFRGIASEGGFYKKQSEKIIAKLE
jgi:tetratricopeptide (TPR) repeat protein